MNEMDEKLIAPCGMNCSLCIAYQFGKYDMNTRGFHKQYCPGCITRGENCNHLGNVCVRLAEGSVRFCYECEKYPCRRLKALDKRYLTKYHMSMIENLDYIKAHGMEKFLVKEEEKWRCKTCEGTICCHNGLCLHCEMDTLLKNKTYRWEVENQLLRDPDIEPTLDVIATALGKSNDVYISFLNELVRHDIHIEWRYYKDGKAWLAKGIFKWTGVRGGQNEKTVFWLSIWDGFFKATIYVHNAARVDILKLPLNDELKKRIQAVQQMGKLKYFPIVFDLYSDELFEDFFLIADFQTDAKR